MSVTQARKKDKHLKEKGPGRRPSVRPIRSCTKRYSHDRNASNRCPSGSTGKREGAGWKRVEKGTSPVKFRNLHNKGEEFGRKRDMKIKKNEGRNGHGGDGAKRKVNHL